MATEVERLKKNLSSLEAKRVELEQRQASNRERKAQIDAKRRQLLLRISEGDNGAYKDKRIVDSEHGELIDRAEAYQTALAEIAEKIEATRNDLRRASRAEIVAQLETQISALPALDLKVGAAVRALNEATASSFAAADSLAIELQAIDSSRFDGNFSFKVRSDIRDGILRSVIHFDKAQVAEMPSFIEAAKIKLRSALAQLAYENLDKIVPAKGEKLYRTNGCIGLRGVMLGPDKLFALTPEEAAEHVKTGYLIEEPQTAA